MTKKPKTPSSPKRASPQVGATANVQASAKVEASATAKWSRERVSLEFIPPDVTRAKSRAILDIFSPVRHAAGLIGDRLKHKREMRKLEREQERQQALEQVADRFKAIRDQSKPIAAPPNKFLYPFIAQASLEEPDSSLIEIWARLLASATDHYDPRYVHFVSVISRLSSRQAEIFTEIVSRAVDSHVLEIMMDENHNTSSSGVRRYVESLFDRTLPWDGQQTELSDEYLCECVHHALHRPTISVVHAAAANETTDDYFDINLSDLMIYEDLQEVDYAILVACGLLERVETNVFPIAGGKWSVELIYSQLTALGQHFAVACRMVLPSAEDVPT